MTLRDKLGREPGVILRPVPPTSAASTPSISYKRCLPNVTHFEYKRREVMRYVFPAMVLSQLPPMLSRAQPMKDCNVSGWPASAVLPAQTAAFKTGQMQPAVYSSLAN
jgi:hypothetical protein